MTTLHIENEVRDYPRWKAVFDKYDAFRAEHNVRSYRLSHVAGEPNRLMIDLDFDSADDAAVFRTALEKVWASPQSHAELVGHARPVFLEIIEERTPSRA